MGWRVTVKAGKVRDMKNKRRKTGRNTGKMRRWSGGATNQQIQQKDNLKNASGQDLTINNEFVTKFVYGTNMHQLTGFFNAIGPVEAGELLKNGEYMIRPIRHINNNYNDLCIAVTYKDHTGTVIHHFIDCKDYATYNNDKLGYEANLDPINIIIQTELSKYNNPTPLKITPFQFRPAEPPLINNAVQPSAPAIIPETILKNSQLFPETFKEERWRDFRMNAEEITNIINSPKHVIFITVQYEDTPVYNENGLSREFLFDWINKVQKDRGLRAGKSSITIGAILYDRYFMKRIRKHDLRLTKFSYICIINNTNPTYDNYQRYITNLFSSITENTHIYVVGHCCNANNEISGVVTFSANDFATLSKNCTNTSAISYIDINACSGYRFFKNDLINELGVQGKFPIVCSNELPINRMFGNIRRIKQIYDYDRINWAYVSKKIGTEIVDLHLSMFYSVKKYVVPGGIKATHGMFSDFNIEKAIDKLFLFIYPSLFDFIKQLPVFYNINTGKAEELLKKDKNDNKYLLRLPSNQSENPTFVISYNAYEGEIIKQYHTRFTVNNDNNKITVHNEDTYRGLPPEPLRYYDSFNTLAQIFEYVFCKKMIPLIQEDTIITYEHRKFLGLPLLQPPEEEKKSDDISAAAAQPAAAAASDAAAAPVQLVDAVFIFDFDCTLTTKHFFYFMNDHTRFCTKHADSTLCTRNDLNIQNAIDTSNYNNEIKQILIEEFFGTERFVDLKAFLQNIKDSGGKIIVASRGYKTQIVNLLLYIGLDIFDTIFDRNTNKVDVLQYYLDRAKYLFYFDDTPDEHNIFNTYGNNLFQKISTTTPMFDVFSLMNPGRFIEYYLYYNQLKKDNIGLQDITVLYNIIKQFVTSMPVSKPGIVKKEPVLMPPFNKTDNELTPYNVDTDTIKLMLSAYGVQFLLREEGGIQYVSFIDVKNNYIEIKLQLPQELDAILKLIEQHTIKITTHELDQSESQQIAQTTQPSFIMQFKAALENERHYLSIKKINANDANFMSNQLSVLQTYSNRKLIEKIALLSTTYANSILSFDSDVTTAKTEKGALYPDELYEMAKQKILLRTIMDNFLYMHPRATTLIIYIDSSKYGGGIWQLTLEDHIYARFNPANQLLSVNPIKYIVIGTNIQRLIGLEADAAAMVFNDTTIAKVQNRSQYEPLKKVKSPNVSQNVISPATLIAEYDRLNKQLPVIQPLFSGISSQPSHIVQLPPAPTYPYSNINNQTHRLNQQFTFEYNNDSLTITRTYDSNHMLMKTITVLKVGDYISSRYLSTLSKPGITHASVSKRCIFRIIHINKDSVIVDNEYYIVDQSQPTITENIKNGKLYRYDINMQITHTDDNSTVFTIDTLKIFGKEDDDIKLYLLPEFIRHLPVFLNPPVGTDRLHYSTLAENEIRNKENLYILRPISDMTELNTFAITYNTPNAESPISNTKLTIINGQIKIKSPWSREGVREPAGYRNSYNTLGEILRLFFNPNLMPYNFDSDEDKYTNDQRAFLGLPLLEPAEEKQHQVETSATRPAAVEGVAQPAEAEVIRLHEVSQREPDPTQPLEEAIGISMPIRTIRDTIIREIGKYPIRVAVGKYNGVYDNGFRRMREVEWRNPAFQAQLVAAHQASGGWPLLEEPLVCNAVLCVAEGYVHIDGVYILEVGFTGHQQLRGVYPAMNCITNVAWTTTAPAPSNNWTVVPYDGRDFPCLFVQDSYAPAVAASQSGVDQPAAARPVAATAPPVAHAAAHAAPPAPSASSAATVAAPPAATVAAPPAAGQGLGAAVFTSPDLVATGLPIQELPISTISELGTDSNIDDNKLLVPFRTSKDAVDTINKWVLYYIKQNYKFVTLDNTIKDKVDIKGHQINPLIQQQYLEQMQSSGNMNDCLIHSFLTAASFVFRKLDREHKNAVARYFRTNICSKIPTHGSLDNQTYIDIKNEFTTSNVLYSENMEILTSHFKIGCLLYRQITMLDFVPATVTAENLPQLYMIVFNPDNRHYDSLKYKNDYLFAMNTLPKNIALKELIKTTCKFSAYNIIYHEQSSTLWYVVSIVRKNDKQNTICTSINIVLIDEIFITKIIEAENVYASKNIFLKSMQDMNFHLLIENCITVNSNILKQHTLYTNKFQYYNKLYDTCDAFFKRISYTPITTPTSKKSYTPYPEFLLLQALINSIIDEFRLYKKELLLVGKEEVSVPAGAAVAQEPAVAPTTVVTAPTTASVAPNKTFTIAPTGTISKSLNTEDTSIKSTKYDDITKIFETTFKNGTVVTAQPIKLNSQVFQCTIYSAITTNHSKKQVQVPITNIVDDGTVAYNVTFTDKEPEVVVPSGDVSHEGKSSQKIQKKVKVNNVVLLNTIKDKNWSQFEKFLGTNDSKLTLPLRDAKQDLIKRITKFYKVKNHVNVNKSKELTERQKNLVKQVLPQIKTQIKSTVSDKDFLRKGIKSNLMEVINNLRSLYPSISKKKMSQKDTMQKDMIDNVITQINVHMTKLDELSEKIASARVFVSMDWNNYKDYVKNTLKPYIESNLENPLFMNHINKEVNILKSSIDKIQTAT